MIEKKSRHMFIYIYVYIQSYRWRKSLSTLAPDCIFFSSLTFVVVAQNEDKWAEVPRTVVFLIVSWLSGDTIWH
jgi:hypothetical protein